MKKRKATGGLAQGSATNDPPPNLKRGTKYYQGKGSVIDIDDTSPRRFFASIGECLDKVVVTSGGQTLRRDIALRRINLAFHAAHDSGGRVYFIGNGGSAAIASHMAVDFTKNGGIRSQAFNDAAALTCFGNDFGYDQVFGAQLNYFATKKDVVVIVSSSGRSLNILDAANVARTIGCRCIVTLSGMNPNNVLRSKGDINFYVPCAGYGQVEIAHLALLHSIIGVAP